ncbi:hypothetical protein HanIR_Chr14g0711561 [Helianthus annuus]|nr:hypothetical protein HanIR_Chr14g0711561 [Helianthus annuus]
MPVSGIGKPRLRCIQRVAGKVFFPGNQTEFSDLITHFKLLHGGFLRHVSDQQPEFGVNHDYNIVPLFRLGSGAVLSR